MTPSISILMSLVVIAAGKRPSGNYFQEQRRQFYMQVNVKSETKCDIEFLMKPGGVTSSIIPKGSALFRIFDADFTFDPLSNDVVLFPNGADHHPIAKKLMQFVLPIDKITFPSTGKYDPETDTMKMKLSITFQVKKSDVMDISSFIDEPKQVFEDPTAAVKTTAAPHGAPSPPVVATPTPAALAQVHPTSGGRWTSTVVALVISIAIAVI